jgi:hypothetical protein
MTEHKENLMNMLALIATKYPALRLCQILGNCYPRREPGYPRGDMYYVEDAELLTRLIQYYHMDGEIKSG